jgi:hypothetical protein
MTIDIDADGGRAVGSHIRLTGPCGVAVYEAGKFIASTNEQARAYAMYTPMHRRTRRPAPGIR